MESSADHKLQEQEIAYIRRDMDRIEKKVDKLEATLVQGLEGVSTQLRMMNDSFVHRREMEKELSRIDDILKDKADKSHFDDVKDIQRKIMWTIVSGVIVAGLAALFTISA